MANNKLLTATCGIVAAAGLSFGAAAIANASTPAASTAASTGYSNGYGAVSGPGGRGSTDAVVSGTELVTVKFTEPPSISTAMPIEDVATSTQPPITVPVDPEI